jgi:hypothetical protein
MYDLVSQVVNEFNAGILWVRQTILATPLNKYLFRY